MTLRWNRLLSATAILLCIVVRPALGAEGEFDRDGSYKTANFRVVASSRELSEKFGDLAEHYRREKAQEWLGREMPNWPQPCPLRVEVQNTGAGGHSHRRTRRQDGTRYSEHERISHTFGRPARQESKP